MLQSPDRPDAPVLNIRGPSFGVWAVGILTSLVALCVLGGMAVLLGLVDPLSFGQRLEQAPLSAAAPRQARSAPVLTALAALPTVGRHAPKNPAHATLGKHDVSHSRKATASRTPSRENARSDLEGAPNTRGSSAPPLKALERSAGTAAMHDPGQPKTAPPGGTAVQGASGAVHRTIAQSPALADPERKSVKPLGYVEKGDGSVEAVVSDAYGVQLVHVGELYEQKFRVASISSDAVELVADSRQPLSSPVAMAVTPANKPELAPSPTSHSGFGHRVSGLAAANLDAPKPGQLIGNRTPISQKPSLDGAAVSKPQATHAGMTTSSSSGPDPPQQGIAESRGPPADLAAPSDNVSPGFSPAVPSETLVVRSYGYAEWEDGRTLAIVDDGEGGVRLVQEGEVVDERFKVVRAYTETVEIAELPLTPSPLGSLLPLEAEGGRLTASQPAMSLSKGSAQTVEAEAERPKPPPDLAADACLQQRQEQSAAIAEQAHSPPVEPGPGHQPADGDFVAGSPPPVSLAGWAGLGQQADSAPNSLWDFEVLSGSVPVLSLLPSAGNADPAERDQSRAIGQQLTGKDRHSGVFRQPSSACRLPLTPSP